MSDTATAETTPAAGEVSVRARRWKARIEAWKALRKDLIPLWAENVDYRRGKQFLEDSDRDRVAYMWDWTATKIKQANLYSQDPEVRGTSPHPELLRAIDVITRRTNIEIKQARVGVAMGETLPDVINATGFGCVYVCHESRVRTQKAPKLDPRVREAMQARGEQVTDEIVSVPIPVSQRITVQRFSPADYIGTVEFAGSNADDMPMQGFSGRCTWSEALSMFPYDPQTKRGLQDNDETRAKVLSADTRKTDERISTNDEQERSQEPIVNYDQIFYRRYRYHADEMSFDAIQRVVFIDGVDEPVVDKLWEGQQRAEDGVTILGAKDFPIRVLSLTYITDEFIPPSDSAAGRAQVNEMIRSRSQMIVQRETNKPINWFDVVRVPQELQDSLMRGTWGGAIPVLGDGSKAMGQIARASHPPEDFAFDRVIKGDLGETWQVSPNQMGLASGGGSGSAIRSASEAQFVQANFNTRIGFERGLTVAFFLGIVRVIVGIGSLYWKWTDKEQEAFGGADPKLLAQYVDFTIRPDSTVLLDAEQRVERIIRFLNIAVKSGYVNPKPLITELAALSGLEMEGLIIDPPPPQPEPISISLRISSREDLNDPLVMAFLVRTKQAPTAEEIEEAKKRIDLGRGGIGSTESGIPPEPPAPNPMEMMGADGQPPQGVPITDQRPDWNTASRVEKRAEDGK